MVVALQLSNIKLYGCSITSQILSYMVVALQLSNIKLYGCSITIVKY